MGGAPNRETTMDTMSDLAYEHPGPCTECDAPDAPNRTLDGRWLCADCASAWACSGCGAVLECGDRCQCDDEEILAEEFAESARRADPRGHI
jgi:hypothetical protein